MAYRPKNLSALGYANGFTLWHYRTEDSHVEIIGDGYFGVNAARMVRVGDFILFNAGVDSKEHAAQSGALVVTEVSPALGVTVASVIA